MKEEAKWDLLHRIQENTEGWENNKGRKSGISYDYECIKAFMRTNDFHNVSVVYGLDSQKFANCFKAFASYLDVLKKDWNKYHAPYKDTTSCVPARITEVCTSCVPEPYFEKMPFPAKVKEHSILTSVLNKSTKKALEPYEQITVKSPVAIVKDHVTKNVEDGHIIFFEDASNIVSHLSRSRKTSVPVLSVRIGDHCYYGLCDIGASSSAIPYELYKEIMHKLVLVNWKISMWLFSLLTERLSFQLVLLEMWKFYAVRLNILLIFLYLVQLLVKLVLLFLVDPF
jgi:hypothetical protein